MRLTMRRSAGAIVALAAAGSAALAATSTAATPPASVDGYMQVCHGSSSSCRTQTLGICLASSGCITTDRVVALNAAGRRVASQKLSHGHFRLWLTPGDY